jgi:hypothetical protein
MRTHLAPKIVEEAGPKTLPSRADAPPLKKKMPDLIMAGRAVK